MVRVRPQAEPLTSRDQPGGLEFARAPRHSQSEPDSLLEPQRHDAGRPEGVVIPAKLVLYIITLSLLKRWEGILLVLLALPLVAGSVCITILIAACNFFHDCL